MRSDEIAAARGACARQAWKDAYAGFRAADEARARLDAEDLERLALCAYMVGKDEVSSDAWARAHSEWLRQGDVPRAARCTFWLVLDLITRRERSQARGWLARTQHVLDGPLARLAVRALHVVDEAREVEDRHGDASRDDPRGTLRACQPAHGAVPQRRVASLRPQ